MKELAGDKGEFEAWVNGIIANLNQKAGQYAQFSTAKLNQLDWKIIREIYDYYQVQPLKEKAGKSDIIWEDSFYEVELIILEAHEIDILDFLHWELVNYYLTDA